MATARDSDSLLLDTDDKKRYYLVHVHGALIKKTDYELKTVLELALAYGHKNIVFNLLRMSNIDVHGIERLERICQAIDEREGKVSFAGIPERYVPLFNRSTLLRSKKRYKTYQEADINELENFSYDSRLGYVVMSYAGVIDTSIVVPLKRAFEILLVEGNENFIFDFSQTSMITSSGISLLVNFHKRLTKDNCRFILTNLGGETKNALAITNVLEVIENCPTNAEAIERITQKP